MQKRLISLGAILIPVFFFGCGPAVSRYPSYERTIEKYAPQGDYEAVRIDNPNDCPRTSYCDCPSIWYLDHWIYWYNYNWIFWNDGYWYNYPFIYIYYYGGIPRVYTRPSLNVSLGVPMAHRGSHGAGSRLFERGQSMDPAQPRDRRPTQEPSEPVRRPVSGQHVQQRQTVSPPAHGTSTTTTPRTPFPGPQKHK